MSDPTRDLTRKVHRESTERRERREALEKWRAGKGPKPPPRAKYPGEVGVGERVRPKIEGGTPIDPVVTHVEKRDSRRLKKECETLVEMLRAEREKTAFLEKIGRPITPKIIRMEKTSGLREQTAVVLASDWHVEEVVEAVKVSYRNSYNLEIAEKRIHRFFTGIIDLVTHHRASKKVVIRDVVLAILGDLLTGYIHEENLANNELSPVETVVWLLPHLTGGIQTLLDKLDLRSISIPVSRGNHSRLTKRQMITTGPENSLEYMMGKILERHFAKDPRVTFDTSKSMDQFVEAYDFTLHFTHGDQISYGGNVGGISIPLLKKIPAWDDVRYAHLHHIGHFHCQTDLGRVMVNGSLIGYNPFARWISAKFEPPQQTFYVLDAKRGKCHVTPLWVDEMLGNNPKVIR